MSPSALSRRIQRTRKPIGNPSYWTRIRINRCALPRPPLLAVSRTSHQSSHSYTITRSISASVEPTAWIESSKGSTREAGGIEVSLEGMIHLSFNRDPEEGAALRFAFSYITQPAASGGERVAHQHAIQLARRRKLPIGVSGEIRAVHRQLPPGRG